MSNGSIFVYNLTVMNEYVKKVAKFTGHTKPVRCLNVNNFNLFSVGHDQIFNCYNFEN